MRENCTYGSMRDILRAEGESRSDALAEVRAFPTGRPALLYTLMVGFGWWGCAKKGLSVDDEKKQKARRRDVSRFEQDMPRESRTFWRRAVTRWRTTS